MPRKPSKTAQKFITINLEAPTPLFPVGIFRPGCACPHKGPIARYSSFICMVCHRAGKFDRQASPRELAEKIRSAYVPDPNLAGGRGRKLGAYLTRSHRITTEHAG